MTVAEQTSATGNEILIGDEDNGVNINEHNDTTKATVPQSSPVEEERGNEHNLPYMYGQIDTEAENATELAQKVCEVKEWKLVDFVNDALKSNARSNTYQKFLARHKVSKLTNEQMRERMVRQYMQMGASEEKARAQIESLLG